MRMHHAAILTRDFDAIHSAFLGDRAHPDAGVVEILEFVGAPLEDHSTPAVPTKGLFLLSFNVDLDAMPDMSQTSRPS